jgi:hypothetical protein
MATCLGASAPCDSQGKLAAQIVDNHFFVNIKGGLSLSHPDTHTLIISEGATIMIKIEFINEHTITVMGTSMVQTEATWR